MAAQDKVTFRQDLTEPVKIRHYEGVVFTGDDCGNIIKVAIFDGGVPYSGGGTVSATAILADGTTYPLTQGSITDNMVSVPLEAGALAVSGLMGLYVKISGDGIICTVLNAIFTVQVTDTGRVPAATVTTVNELVQEIKDAQDSFPADLTNLLAAVAPTFSTSTAYSAGAYVWQGGKLYRFTAAHPAGTWTGTDAVTVALGDDVADLKSASKYIGYNPVLRNGTTTNIYNTQQVAVDEIIPWGKANSITVLINKAVSAEGNFWRLVFDTFSVDSGKPEDNASNRITITSVIDKTKITIFPGYFDSTSVGFAFSIAEKTTENGTVTHRIDDFTDGDVIIAMDYAYLGNVEANISTLSNAIEDEKATFEEAFLMHKNYLEYKTPDTGYIWSRTTGGKTSNQYGKVYDPIEVTAGTTYYYRNIYAYFSVFVSGSTVIPIEASDSSASLSGAYTPNANGVIKITKHVDDTTDTLFTNSEVLYLSGDFTTYYSSNHFDPSTEIYVGPGRQYTRLRDGIAEGVTHRNATVYVEAKADGSPYDLTSEFADEITANLSGVWFGNPLYNGIHIVFRSGAKVVCNYTGGIQNITSYFNPFIAIKDGNFTLENLDISVKNVRYCVHDERSSSTFPRTAKYINCKMEMDNTSAVINWYPQCIGGGNGCHDYIDIRGCWFKSKTAETDVIPLVSYHNNNSGTETNLSHVNVSDCYFADKGTFRVTYSGPANVDSKSVAYVHNCSLGAEMIIGQENPSDPAPENYEMISWMNEVRQ